VNLAKVYEGFACRAARTPPRAPLPLHTFPMGGVIRWPTRVVVLSGLAVLAVGLAGPSGAAAAHPGAPRLTTLTVRPSATDQGLAGPNDPNLAVLGPRASWNGLLLVFLPGSGGQPACCSMFLDEAATLGYHAVGLTYDNTVAVGSRCLNDLSCYGAVRQDVFDGSDPTAPTAIVPRDGVEHRLAALLATLARTHPGDGWGAFVAHGKPQYRSIVLAGHSQGGGEAAFIGTRRPLRGVISLSSPPDTNDLHVAAPWLSSVPGGATPLDRYYAFVHAGDPFLARIEADWAAMGLGALGPITSVDQTGPPYGLSHELLSSAALPPVVLATHDSTAVDGAQPLCPGGSSEYVAVWRYLLQAAGGLPVTASSPGCP
jgi:hypothetical protein